MSWTRQTLTERLPNGKGQQVLRKLQTRDVDVGDYCAIGTNDALLDDIVAAILKHRLFTPLEEQIKRILEINEQTWKDKAITEAAIREIGDPPDCPVSDENGLYCACLLSETGDAVQTFERNWQACVHVHGQDGTWKWDGLLFTPKGVKQRDNTLPRRPGLRWQIAELGRKFNGQCVRDVRPQLKVMGMGQELPLIAALHPKWAVSMNGENIPYVDAPDLEVAPYAEGGFSCAPYLLFRRGHRQVRLDADHVDDSSSGFGSGSLQ